LFASKIKRVKQHFIWLSKNSVNTINNQHETAFDLVDKLPEGDSALEIKELKRAFSDIKVGAVTTQHSYRTKQLANGKNGG